MEKKLIFIIFGFILLAGIIYAADHLIEPIIVVKDNPYYHFYKYEKTYTIDSIDEEKIKLDKEINDIRDFIPTIQNDCSYCPYEFEIGIYGSEEECILNCEESGSWITESEKMYIES